jgi:hypothetical protein
MTSTSHTRIVASGGVVLLTLAVFVLLVSIAQAAQPSLTQLQRAHGGADVTYAAAPLSQLQRAHGGADVTYAAAPLSQLQRAHGGANVAYVAAAPGRGAISAVRGAVFIRTKPVATSTGGAVGGIVVTALVIALVAFLALASRPSRRGDSGEHKAA